MKKNKPIDLDHLNYCEMKPNTLYCNQNSKLCYYDGRFFKRKGSLIKPCNQSIFDCGFLSILAGMIGYICIFWFLIGLLLKVFNI